MVQLNRVGRGKKHRSGVTRQGQHSNSLPVPLPVLLFRPDLLARSTCIHVATDIRRHNPAAPSPRAGHQNLVYAGKQLGNPICAMDWDESLPDAEIQGVPVPPPPPSSPPLTAPPHSQPVHMDLEPDEVGSLVASQSASLSSRFPALMLCPRILTRTM